MNRRNFASFNRGYDDDDESEVEFKIVLLGD